MGIALETNTEKTKLYSIDEAWNINIESAKNAQAKVGDPKVTVRRREGDYYSDGSFQKATTTTEGHVAKHSFTMSEIVARTDTLAYRDKTGADKTIPMADAPYIVKALVDGLGAEERQAKLDAIAQAESEADPEV